MLTAATLALLCLAALLACDAATVDSPDRALLVTRNAACVVLVAVLFAAFGWWMP